MPRPVLVVSPHLDDAVLSCFHLLASQPALTVLTVFAGDPGATQPLGEWDQRSGFVDPGQAIERRRAEDRAALGRLRALPVHADLVDHQYRRAGGAADLAAVRAVITAQVAALAGRDAAGGTADSPARAVQVWAPAGIGGHPDHVAARDAALSAVRAPHQLVLYADLPHALTAGAAWEALRRAGTDGEHSAASLAAQMSVAAAVPPTVPPTAVALPPAGLRAKGAAVGCYASQLRPLERVFGPLARWLGAGEIYWQLPPRP